MAADNDTWKWWYYVLAGLLLIAFGGFQLLTGHVGKGIGGVVLGLLAIVVGVASRPTSA